MPEKSSLLHLGVDIGAVYVRNALVDNNGKVIYTGQEIIGKGGPSAALHKLTDDLKKSHPLSEISSAAATGRGRLVYQGHEGWSLFTSPYCAVKGLKSEEPKPKTIVIISGQGSMNIHIVGEKWKTSVSPLCAAGTGKFLEQQATRLEIPIEDFGPLALEWNKEPPRVASRCSVFAKSDLIHLQQKGWPRSAMLAGLSDSVARMVRAQSREEIKGPVYLIGGVAANQGVVRAVGKVLREDVFVPANFTHREAIGAALLSNKSLKPPEDFYPHESAGIQFFYIPNKLKPIEGKSTWKPEEIRGGKKDVYLGVDVGSTSTKIAIIDSQGNVIAKKYVMTSGQPLKAIQAIMADPEIAPMEPYLNIKAVGVTGSGRYLVGNAIGADSIKNEITAQTRAARHIDPDVETIIELGGQDSKYIYFNKNGVVLRFCMNKACAAGTGSFIDELAEQLGTSTRNGEFARLAFEAQDRLDLGEKCTAFMGQAVSAAQQEGVPLPTIIASLAPSLVQNYLSKVAGKIGKKVFLTGAVFYNDAAVSAFQAELPDRQFFVPEHKEVTGAIGAALLAKEEISGEASSRFKGFREVAEDTYDLKYFNCGNCEHACAISSLTGKEGTVTYYGSRCDLFDAKEAGKKHEKAVTPFNRREELLFADYDKEKGSGYVVGIPRALMAYDYAPMLTGFLNALGVKVLYTSETTPKVIDKATQLAYPESCLPIKLVYGHVAKLLEANADYVLIPNAIRLAEKNGDADQHYACPLVQSAPYIEKSAFGLGDKLLDPVIDFSKGEEAVIKSFAEIAQRLGFSKEEGIEAITQGLENQREFQRKLKEEGKKVLKELEDKPDAIGVVFLSRAYNSQDSGANLGMSEALRKLGVVPIPMDLLPLEDEDISDITKLPYWHYERKIYAASKVIVKNPQLFGLFLSNFGCGPNSFIEKRVEAIMGDKPFGQIEVDEHAAEAGFVTRLEALVDTLNNYRKAGIISLLDPAKYSRISVNGLYYKDAVIIPYMSDHAPLFAASMYPEGVAGQYLPPSTEESFSLTRDVTSGKECLPFRDCIGQILLANEENQLPPKARFLMAGAFGPCRLGKYGEEIEAILKQFGIDLKVTTTVSDNSYSDLGFGKRFEMRAYNAILAGDFMQKMLWRTRPYEKVTGQTDQAYSFYMTKLETAVKEDKSLGRIMREAADSFFNIRDNSLPDRPLVGINGEIYLRVNTFCNKDLVRLCEQNGLEAEVAPMIEWINYITLRRWEDALADRDVKKLFAAGLRWSVTSFDQKMMQRSTKRVIHKSDPTPAQLIKASSVYLPSRNGSEAVLSIGSGIKHLTSEEYAGEISVGPHGCMPGGIVAALSESVQRTLGGKPWINLSFDGFPEQGNAERVAYFAEQIKSQTA